MYRKTFHLLPLLALGFAVAGLPSVALAQGSPFKVGVIDIQKVLKTSLSGKEALRRLQDAADKKEEFLKKKQKELEALQKQYNTAPLSSDKKSELETKIQTLIKDVNRFKEDARVELQKAEEQELRGLEAEVMPLIGKIGKGEGFQAIFGKQQSGLVFMDPALDITDHIIEAYDAARKSGNLAKPAAGKGGK